MRPIKFRVWSSKYSAMDFPISIGIDDSGHIDHVTGYGAEYNDGEFELMQFAGLKDKNGREIYEGDIVHAYDQEPDRYEPDYRGSEATGIVEFHGSMFMLDADIVLDYPPIIEVIGNVHQNPELLEEKK